MADVLNAPLHDADMLAEIELVTELMARASESDGPVSQRTLDEILQVPGKTA